MARSPIRRGVVVRVTIGVIAVALGLGAAAVSQGPGRFTTYAGHSILAAVLALTAGFALVAAGLFVSLSRSQRVVGHLAMLAGVCWLAPLWVGWHGGPALVRSVGMVATEFTFPLVVHAALAHPHGRVETAAGRVLVVAAYVAAGVVAFGLALFRDPFFDPYCWSNCTDNSFLVTSLPPVARGLEVAARLFTVAAAGAFVTVSIARLVNASGPARRTLLPVAIAAILFAGGVTAHAIALQIMPKEDPSDPIFYSTFAITSAAAALLAGGFLWGLIRTRLHWRAVARIVTSLGEAPPPAFLQSALAQAVGDPQLRVAYWLENARHYVDAHGQPAAEPSAAPGRAITTLMRGERRIAVISHTAGVTEIESALGPALRLALENEQLRAEGLAQLDELRASRSRVVETGDAERRRLERDLHDGAQQRLVAASYEISLARASAEAKGDGGTSAALATALEGVHVALDELREIAHGIYPQILAESGLASAVTTLADKAPIVLDIRDVTDERYPDPVEIAAYLLIVEAIDDASTRGATYATVTAVRANNELIVTVDDDGPKRTSSMVQLGDRVGALGGRLEVGSMNLRAAIPCE